MVNGVITMSGTGEELLAREEVRAAYLEGGGIDDRPASFAPPFSHREKVPPQGADEGLSQR